MFENEFTEDEKYNFQYVISIPNTGTLKMTDWLLSCSDIMHNHVTAEKRNIYQVRDKTIRRHKNFFRWYRNSPKFADRYAWANSADPDQTAPRGAV